MTHRSGALILWIVKGKLLDAKHISMTRYEDEAFDSFNAPIATRM